MATEIDLKGKMCTINSEEHEITAKDFIMNAESIFEIGDQSIVTNSYAFGNDDTKKKENEELEQKNSKEDEVENDKDQAQSGGSKKKKLVDGLNTLQVTPRWRKNTPTMNANADSENKLMILSRVSAGTQEYVLSKIAELYTAESAVQDKQIKSPTDLSNLGKLIDEGIAIKEKVIQADIENRRSFFTSLGMGSDFRAKINNENVIASLERDLKEQKEIGSRLKTHLQNHIKKDLRPVNAETMGEGYIYIFLQDSRVEDFEKLSLFGEYKATIKNREVSYSNIDIAEYKCCDYRTSQSGAASPQIELPSCYGKNTNSYELEKVVVLFSVVQLSAARLAKIETDTSLQTKHAQTLDVCELKDNFDMSLSASKALAKAKADDIEDTYKNSAATQIQWQELETYPIYDYDDRSVNWNLLLDNPLGVLDQNNVAIFDIQSKLSTICVDIQADSCGKSAILIANFLFNPQMSGLIDANLGGMDGSSFGYNTSKMYGSDEIQASYKNLVTKWTAQNSKLEEVKRTKATIDIDNLKYSLRSNSRELMRKLMEAFQHQVLEWIDPTDSLIECWRDVFSQGAYGYSSSFNRWFDSMNHLSIDPKDTDSLYDVIADRPIDKIDVISSSQIIGFGDVTQTQLTLTGYTLTNYEYHLDYYKKTVTTYDEKLKLKNTKVSYIDKDDPSSEKPVSATFIKDHAPKGLVYITKALKSDVQGDDNDIITTMVANSLSQITGKDAKSFLADDAPEVSKLLVPSNSSDNPQKGEYDAKKLALSSKIELILGQHEIQSVDRNQLEDALKKYSQEYMEKGAKKVLGDENSKMYDIAKNLLEGKSLAQQIIPITKIDKVETCITSFINKVHIRYSNHEFTKSLLSYKPQRDKFTKLIEDSFEVQNIFNADKDSGKPLMTYLLHNMENTKVTTAKEVSPLLSAAAKGRGIDVQERYYRGETHYFLEENSYSNLQTTIDTETKDYLSKVDSTNLIKEDEFEKLKNTSIGSLRYEALMGVIESTYGTYSAISELNDKVTELQEKNEDPIATTILCLGIYKQIFEVQNNCIKLVDEWNKYRLDTKLKAIPLTELFGTIESDDLKGARNLKARRKTISQLVKKNDVIIGTLGLGISTLQLMQSIRALAQSSSKNDEHAIRADLANLINASATTLSSAQGIAKTLQGAEKKTAETVAKATFGGAAKKVGTEVAKKDIERKATITLIEKLGVRAATALTIPYLGEVLLVIDVATTLWMMYEEANKDNIYQKWVKLSSLYPN